MGPPGRGRPASEIRLGRSPHRRWTRSPPSSGRRSQPSSSRTTIWRKPVVQPLAGRRAAKAALPHFVRRIAILVVAATAAIVLLDHDLERAAGA